MDNHLKVAIEVDIPYSRESAREWLIGRLDAAALLEDGAIWQAIQRTVGVKRKIDHVAVVLAED